MRLRFRNFVNGKKELREALYVLSVQKKSWQTFEKHVLHVGFDLSANKRRNPCVACRLLLSFPNDVLWLLSMKSGLGDWTAGISSREIRGPCWLRGDPGKS